MGDLGELSKWIARPSQRPKNSVVTLNFWVLPYSGPSLWSASMMMQRVFAAAVLGFAVCASATPAQALGCKLFGKKNDCCAAAVGCVAPAAPAAPAMTTQTVTRYVSKPVVTKQSVTTTTMQWVDEAYSWQECVTTPKTAKQPVTTTTMQWVDEAHSWQECVTTPKVTKQPVTTTTMQWVEEAYTYTVCKPVTTMVQKPVCRTVCVPVQVPYTVAHHSKVCVPVCSVDRCGCPTVSYRTERVTTCETCYKTVMQKQTVTEMATVPVTTLVNSPMTGTRKVCKPITTTTQQDVTTYTSAMVTRTGTHKVCKPVTTTTQQDVTTYTSAMVTRTGTRKVCKPVTTTAMVDVTTYKTEAVTETIQVPVAAPYTAGACGTCSSMYAPVSDCGSAKKGCKLFGGLFHHKSKSSCGCN
jgi:hypothetical protein